MKNRKFEYFNKTKLKHQKIISNPPLILYPQERDWTCSIACIRTLLSKIKEYVPKEITFINTFNLKPNPYFSKDLKIILEKFDIDVVYGCDSKINSFDDILDLSQQGYYIMLESMYNVSHWIVFLGYYPIIDNSVESSKLLIYDPYYDEVKLINTDEFIAMWKDGSNKDIQNDFIAIKQSSQKLSAKLT